MMFLVVAALANPLSRSIGKATAAPSAPKASRRVQPLLCDIALSCHLQRLAGGLRQPEPAADEADGGKDKGIVKTRVDISGRRDQREGRHRQQSANPSGTNVVRHGKCRVAN